MLRNLFILASLPFILTLTLDDTITPFRKCDNAGAYTINYYHYSDMPHPNGCFEPINRKTYTTYENVEADGNYKNASWYSMVKVIYDADNYSEWIETGEIEFEFNKHLNPDSVYEGIDCSPFTVTNETYPAKYEIKFSNDPIAMNTNCYIICMDMTNTFNKSEQNAQIIENNMKSQNLVSTLSKLF